MKILVAFFALLSHNVVGIAQVKDHFFYIPKEVNKDDSYSAITMTNNKYIITDLECINDSGKNIVLDPSKIWKHHNHLPYTCFFVISGETSGQYYFDSTYSKITLFDESIQKRIVSGEDKVYVFSKSNGDETIAVLSNAYPKQILFLLQGLSFKKASYITYGKAYVIDENYKH